MMFRVHCRRIEIDAVLLARWSTSGGSARQCWQLSRFNVIAWCGCSELEALIGSRRFRPHFRLLLAVADRYWLLQGCGVDLCSSLHSVACGEKMMMLYERNRSAQFELGRLLYVEQDSRGLKSQSSGYDSFR